MYHFIKSVFIVTCMAIAVALGIAAAMMTAEAASDYPAKPVKIVVAKKCPNVALGWVPVAERNRLDHGSRTLAATPQLWGVTAGRLASAGVSTLRPSHPDGRQASHLDACCCAAGHLEGGSTRPFTRRTAVVPPR